MTQEIATLIENKDFKGLKNTLQEMLIPDIADTLDNIEDPATTILVYRLLPKALSAEVFSYISPDAQETIIGYLNNNELSFIIEELATDDAVDFLEEMPANIVEKVLKSATPETRKTINKYLSYKEDTAGAIMTPEFVRIKLGTTVDAAFDHVRKQCQDAETINVLYVVDDKKTLKGVLTIKELLLAKKEQIINFLQWK